MPEVTLVIIAPAGLVTVWRWLSVSLLSTADATRLQQMPLQLILYFRDRAEVMNSQEISVYNAVYSAPVGGPHAYFTVLCGTSKTVPRANKWLKFVLEQYLHFKCFQWLILIHCNICCWSAKPIRWQHTAQVFVHCSTSASETKQVWGLLHSLSACLLRKSMHSMHERKHTIKEFVSVNNTSSRRNFLPIV